MKGLIAIFLCIGLLSASLQDIVIYVSFKANQKYIAKNLCIEKDIETSSCNGHCQLTKRIEESKEQSEFPTTITERIQFNFIANSIEIEMGNTPVKGKAPFFHQPYEELLLGDDIFHPPITKC